MRRRKQDISGIPPLLTFSRVKQNCLTITGSSTLRLLSEHYTQAQIAKRLGTSKPAITYWVKKLERLGLWIKPKNARVKQNDAGGAPLDSFDVRFRSLKWILTKPVKLPFDESTFNNGLEQRVWRLKECLIRVNIGSQGGYSLEIEAGYCGGRSPDECNHKHDTKAVNLFEWLSEHYPELKQYSGSYIVNRPGELQVLALQPLAKRLLADRGGGVIKLGEPPIIKVDQSRGYPELQFLTESLATKEDIRAMVNLLNASLELLKQCMVGTKALTTCLTELNGTIKELILGSVKPPEKPDGGAYR